MICVAGGRSNLGDPHMTQGWPKHHAAVPAITSVRGACRRSNLEDPYIMPQGWFRWPGMVLSGLK
jgi:hypothetical protein